MTKRELMNHWKSLKPNQAILPHMTPVEYKAKGSRYGACGIRIDGNADFIDAVLSRLKDLLDGENNETRLAISRNEVNGNALNKSFANKEMNAECCYIRLAERGHEAKIFNAICNSRKSKIEDEWLD